MKYNANIKLVIKNTIAFFCRLFPLRNKIICGNMGGRGMGDDPKHIVSAIHRINNVPIYWLVSKLDASPFPEWVKQVKIGSISSIYHICTAKIWISNARNMFVYKKREDQYYLQTWHSTLGIKKAEGDTPTLPLSWQRASKDDSDKIDLAYANNNIIYNFLRNSFWYSGPVIRIGQPRIAFLKKNYFESRKKVREFYSIAESKKIIMYAPTLRRHDNFEVYYYDYDKVKKSAEERFGCEYVFVVRLHPIYAEKVSELRLPDDIINATLYPDMEELLCASDILISDFSSCMNDFSILKKPVFLFAKDYDDFIQNDREFLIDINILPYPISKNEDELCSSISKFNSDKYLNDCEIFFKEVGLVDDGNGDVEVGKIIIAHLFN